MTTLESHFSSLSSLITLNIIYILLIPKCTPPLNQIPPLIPRFTYTIALSTLLLDVKHQYPDSSNKLHSCPKNKNNKNNKPCSTLFPILLSKQQPYPSNYWALKPCSHPQFLLLSYTQTIKKCQLPFHNIQPPLTTSAATTLSKLPWPWLNFLSFFTFTPTLPTVWAASDLVEN